MTHIVEKSVIDLLNKSGICVLSFNNLDGFVFERNILLNDSKMENMYDEINLIKETFSVSSIQSLQKNAKQRQKWPLLNLVRQVLKNVNYKMTPFRECNGYDKEKKKIFVRYFRIEKISQISNSSDNED
tara:strand:+ start:139 stop:525 length:387 start_codon:yes stop_codon:yes gene_type:complete